MASTSGTFFFPAGGENRSANAVRRRRHAVDADPNRIVNRVEDGGSCWNHNLFADPFGAEGANRRRSFDEYWLHRRHIARGWDQVVVKILALAGKEFFHQRHSQSLRSATFDLPLDKSRINGTTDIVSGGDLQHPHCAQFSIDGNLGQVRAKSEDGIRSALAVFIQRAGGRIESCLAGKHVAVLIQRQVTQGKRALSEIVLLIVLSNSNATIFENNARALASICQPQDGTPQFRSRHLGGFSRDEGLA